MSNVTSENRTSVKSVRIENVVVHWQPDGLSVEVLGAGGGGGPAVPAIGSNDVTNDTAPDFCIQSKRRAFTLTEMLVVMGVLIVLAVMAAAIVPSFLRQEGVHAAATRTQQALKVAKSRAMADKRPAGVRLYTTNYLATELHFTEKPDDIGNQGTAFADGGLTVNFDFSGGSNPITGGLDAIPPANWPVVPGDYLELNGGGLAHRIIAVSANIISVASNVPAGTTKQWRVQRGPRTLRGEQPIKLPQGIVIDTLTNDLYGNPLPFTADLSGIAGNGWVDFLFAPSGHVLDRTASRGSFLWIRRADSDNPRSGAMVITIKYATGWIAVNEIDQNGTNPYSLADDPRQSGL